MVDPETGVDYECRQSTDETEIELVEFEMNFESNVERRMAIFKNSEREYRKWINGHIDIILRGWSCGNKAVPLPAFPDKNPSAKMPGILKMKILNWWNAQKNFSLDDIKN